MLLSDPCMYHYLVKSETFFATNTEWLKLLHDLSAYIFISKMIVYFPMAYFAQA